MNAGGDAMSWISDAALGHLRTVIDRPELPGERYEIIEPLGRGGMGVVYRVRDRVLDRDAALKVLDLPGDRPDLARRLLHEARILARLEHPGIVPVHDAGTLADGRPFYVMKLVRGQRLDAYAEQPPSLAARLRVFERLCDTVAFAHAHGVIHRDLKPENVMVGPFGEVLVLDWGVAKALRDGNGNGPAPARAASTRQPSTGAGTVIGTPGYMAPEQAHGEVDRVDRRADVYALGAILQFLVPRQDDRSIPRPLRAICGKAMRPDPEDRYPDVVALGRDIGAFLEGAAVAALPEGLVGRAVRFARRHRTALLLILAYLVMRMLLLTWRAG